MHSCAITFDGVWSEFACPVPKPASGDDACVGFVRFWLVSIHGRGHKGHSEAAHLADVSREVRDLYRDFVEMCVHLRTSILWVDVGYQWTGEGNLQTRDGRHPDPERNLGTVLLGGVYRLGNDWVYIFFVENLGRSYPHVVVHTA